MKRLAVVAPLANCGGGKLVFGITDQRPRHVVGSKAFEQPERTRKGLMDKLKIMVDFQLYDYDGKRVLVFDVAGRPLGLPVQVDGVAWWYEGDSLIPLRKECVEKYMKKLDLIFQAASAQMQNYLIWTKRLSKSLETDG